MTLSALEATPVLPAASVAVAVRLWAPLASAAVVIGPGAGAVRGGAAEQRRAVVDLDRAVGFRRAGQRQGIVIGDAVADGAAVGRERGDARGNRRRRVDGHAQARVEATPVLPAASVAVAVRLWAPLASAAVVIAPGAGAVGGGAAEQRGAVVDLDRAVGFRRAGQRQGIVIGDAVADGAAVGRERGDARGNRRRRVDGHAQRASRPRRYCRRHRWRWRSGCGRHWPAPRS